MSWLEEKYAIMAFSGLRNFKEKRHNPPLYNFSCPVCGDSGVDITKARGYLYDKEGHLKYKCHNCNTPIGFLGLLKHVNQDIYKTYIIEKFGDTHKEKKTPILGRSTNKILKKNKENPLKILQPLTEEDKMYLLDRKIDDFTGMYSIDKMSKLKPFLLEEEIELGNDPRIVIPVLNRSGEAVGAVCRTTNPRNELRYLNIKFTEEPMIYNAYNVNRNKKIHVLEGIMDSKFVDNSVAVCGSDLMKVEELFPKEDVILIFDNQPRNRQILRKMEIAIQSGFPIVIWPENFDKFGKDINKIVIEKSLNKEDISGIVADNTFKGMKALAKFKTWRKIV